jgi:hypothetical protein
LLLCQLSLSPDPREISSDKSAHVHTKPFADGKPNGLSTIICIFVDMRRSRLGRELVWR